MAGEIIRSAPTFDSDPSSFSGAVVPAVPRFEKFVYPDRFFDPQARSEALDRFLVSLGGEFKSFGAADRPEFAALSSDLKSLERECQELLPTYRDGAELYHTVADYRALRGSLPEREARVADLCGRVRWRVGSIDSADVLVHSARFAEHADQLAHEWRAIRRASIREYPRGLIGTDTMVSGGTGEGTTTYAHEEPGRYFIQNREILEIEAGFYAVPTGSISVRIPPNAVPDDYDPKDAFSLGDAGTLKFIDFVLTRDGRHVLQQWGQRGCVAACVNMMALDRGQAPSYQLMNETNLASLEDGVRWLRWLGVEAVHHTFANPFSRFDLERRGLKIERLVNEKGSLILSVGGEFGNHVVIIDDLNIANNCATIREPAQGLSLRITAKALLNRVGNEAIFGT